MSWVFAYLGPKVFGALASLAAFLGVVVALRSDAKKEERQRAVAARNAERLDAMRRQQEIEDEVEALDTDTLKRRAGVWVHGDKR